VVPRLVAGGSGGADAFESDGNTAVKVYDLPMIASPDALVTAFFARWAVAFDEMCRSFEATLSHDCVWDQRPLARTVGPGEAVRFLERSRTFMALDTIEVELVSLAVNQNVVHTARIDHLRRADGSVLASAAVAGVLRVEGDQIIGWREYFDPTNLAFQAVGSGVRSAVRAARARVLSLSN
jgi:limonene-1,2-epoxide hydrolase